MLLRARRREADPTYLCGIAAEIFNRSPHHAEVSSSRRGRATPTSASARRAHAAAPRAGHLRLAAGRLATA